MFVKISIPITKKAIEEETIRLLSALMQQANPIKKQNKSRNINDKTYRTPILKISAIFLK